VPFEAEVGEIERRAAGDELGGSIQHSLFQVHDDC
jgi:hypothetical protein